MENEAKLIFILGVLFLILLAFSVFPINTSPEIICKYSKNDLVNIEGFSSSQRIVINSIKWGGGCHYEIYDPNYNTISSVPENILTK